MVLNPGINLGRVVDTFMVNLVYLFIKALEMIHNIREAFSELLEEVPWMDDNTREVAREKVGSTWLIYENITPWISSRFEIYFWN